MLLFRLDGLIDVISNIGSFIHSELTSFIFAYLLLEFKWVFLRFLATLLKINSLLSMSNALSQNMRLIFLNSIH